MDFGNSPRAQLTDSFMRIFSDFFPEECIINLTTEQYNKVYKKTYDLIGYLNLKHFLADKKEELEDEAKIYRCKMTREDVINKFSKTLDEYYQIEIGSPMNENLTEILRTAIDQANRAETLVMPTLTGDLENDLQIIYKEGKPHGIRDKSGYLLFFTEIFKYDGQMERYRKEIDNQKKLAEYLLDKLSKCSA